MRQEDYLRIWEEFLETRMEEEVLALADSYPDKRSLYVPFKLLEHFNQEIADDLLDHPKQILSAGNEVLRSMDLPMDVTLGNAFLRVISLPPTSRLKARNLREYHPGKFVAMEGMVRMASKVFDAMTDVYVTCQRCGSGFLVKPAKIKSSSVQCNNSSCDRPGPFVKDLDRSLWVAKRVIQLQENPEGLKGGELPETIGVILTGDLVENISPGNRVIVNGIVRLKEIKSKAGDTLDYEPYIEAVSVEVIEREFEEIDITPEDEREILELSKSQTLIEDIRGSIAPTIYGQDDVKEAIALQLVSSPPVSHQDGTRTRGDIHILLVGDPGIAKSQLLKYVIGLAPRGVFTSGKGSTAAGLTASAVKDEMSDGRWTIEAGALPMADMGLCAVDEMDKMQDNDRDALHEGLEQQCYDAKTEVLTENGWKLFKDVQDGEKVATLSPEFKLEYVIPTTKVVADYNGPTISVQTRQVNLLVTPNHNMFVSLNRGGNNWDNFSLTRADRITEKRMKFKKNAEWCGEEVERYTIPGVVIKHNQNHEGVVSESIVVGMDLWLEFLGYFLSEGSIRGIKGVPYSVTISQSKEPNKTKMELCIKKLGLNYSESKGHITIYSKQLATHLAIQGKQDCRFIPDYVKPLSPRQQNILLQAMMLGDGNKSKYTGHEIYTTISKMLADDVQELCLKIGLSANIYKKNIDDIPSSVIRGREIIPRHDCYIVSIVRFNEPQVNHNGFRQFKQKEYSGKIYCLEVPYHTLYVRRHGKPVWCGNTISVSKAGINATLRCRCSVLAAANPKLGRFDLIEPISSQIKLAPTLLSRFDLIFVLFDTPEQELDSRISSHILNVYMDDSVATPPIPPELLRKYIAYARRTITPQMTQESSKALQEYYLGVRAKYNSGPNQPVPTTARQLQALMRLSVASARLRLSNIVELQDANRAIALTDACLRKVGIDQNTGNYDAGAIDTGFTKTHVDAISTLKTIIRDICKNNTGIAPALDILKAATEAGLNEDRAQKVLERMRQGTEIMEPRPGYYRLV